MLTEELLTELRTVLPEDQVIEGEKNHPLGNCGNVMVIPKSEAEIIAIVQYAFKNSKSLNIQGGGTKRGCGGLNQSADILLSLSQYKGIVEHVVGDMTLTVWSGTNFKEVKDYLAQYNQKIPLDPFHPKSVTIGGVISSNDSGPKRLGYGSSRDTVIGLRVIYSDGKVIRTGGKVVKNVAGYDMNKLFYRFNGNIGCFIRSDIKAKANN